MNNSNLATDVIRFPKPQFSIALMDFQMFKKPVFIFCFVLIASQLSAQSTNRDSAAPESDGLVELMQHGASIGAVHGDGFSGRPELPILDEDGNVHPSSCNPHINFFDKELDIERLELVLPHLKNLRPNHRASHVAVYLPKKLYDDEPLVEKLKKQLPHCQIFFEHHKANSHRVPINRPEN